MRFDDIAPVNIPASSGEAILRSTRRLLRDLVAVGLMQTDRPTATQRLEAKLGDGLVHVLTGSLTDGGRPHGLRPRRAA